jgi:1-acyl-sn-glycerol-3-phosphate acyltransferase
MSGEVLWRPLRVAFRLTAGVSWCILCSCIVLLLNVLKPVAPHVAKRWQRGVARTWLVTMPALLGMRITQVGKRPEAPFFLVGNHITWTDFFAMNYLCDVSCVSQYENKITPILGRLFSALDPIYVVRRPEYTPLVLQEMVATLRAGKSMLMAPEAVIGPGRTVHQFRAGLLEAAILTNTPVHYSSVTYRTPEGCPPPSESVLFGPDPNFRDENGQFPQAAREAWGKERTFLGQAVRMLALPWFEIEVRFGAKPISAPDKVTLANELHDAVLRIFTPVE